jgi:hypothetical protein
MNKQDAISILGSRTPITAPGKYRVKVTNCNPFSKTLSNGTTVVAIANFSAMTPYQMEQAKADLVAGEGDKALNHNLSLSIRSTDYNPSKGERVDIDVEYVETKDGEQALLVVGLTPVKAVITNAKCDFSAFLDAVEVTVDADPTAIS